MVHGGQRLREGSLVGRGSELAQLQAALDQAVTGHGRLVLITGDAGIGKTRLAVEFAAHATRTGARVLWGRSADAPGAPAYRPWSQVLATYVRSADPAVIDGLGPDRAYLAHVLPELAQQQLPTGPTPLSSERDRFQLSDAVARLLRTAAQERPLVLLLEDVHAADPSSLLLLRFIATELTVAPVLLVATSRPVSTLGDPDTATSVADAVHTAHTLPLRGLSRSQTGTLLIEGHGWEVSEQVLTAVWEATGGNPFFAIETARLLAAEGRLTDVGAGGLDIPDGVRHTIRQQLAALPEDVRALLSVGAVIGPRFSLAVLERVSELPRDRIVAALDVAAGRGLLATPRIDLGSYDYGHALVRETLYADLSPARRLGLHGQVGVALQEVYGANLEAHLDEVAAHLLIAAPDGRLAEAIGIATRAGRAAIARLAYEQAVDLLTRARDLAEQWSGRDERRYGELLVELAQARMRAGQADAAKVAFREAARHAEEHAFPDLQARAALGLGGQWAFTGETADPELVNLLEKALAALPDDERAVRARLLARLAEELYHADPPERAEHCSRQAVELARSTADSVVLGHALLARLFVLWRPRHPDHLRQRLLLDEEVLRLAERTGDPELELHGRSWRVIDLLESGDVTGADTQISAFARTAAAQREPFYLWFVPVFAAMRALMQGRYAEAEEHAERALAAGRRAQGARELAENAIGVHVIQTLLIQREHGTAPAEPPPEPEAAPVRQALEAYPRQAAWRAAAALRELARGNETEARTQYAVLSADDFRVLFTGEGSLVAVALTAELCAAFGDAGQVAHLYRRLAPFAGRHILIGHPALAYQGAVDLYLGTLAAAQDEHGTAVGHFQDAVAMHSGAGAAPWVARSEYELARALQARGGPGDDEASATLFRHAGRIATELVMPRLRARIEDAVTTRPDAPPAEPAPAPAPRPAVFRPDGEYWTVTLGPETVRVRDVKGMRYLRRLLEDPGREFHVLDLAAGGVRGGAPGAAVAEGLRAGGDDAGPLLDAQAKEAYRRRLRHLRADLAAAEEAGDYGRAAGAQEEIDALAHELARAVGLGGRDRKAGSITERARVNVSRAIRAAIARIEERSPSTGHHLATTVRTGAYCVYTPDPAAAPAWNSDPR